MPWIDSTEGAQPLELTDEALNLYERIRELKCTCAPRPDDMAYYDSPDECAGCVTWAILNRHLADLIKLPLHEVHCVPPPHGECFLREEEESRRNAFEHALAERKDEPS